jgi:BirA family transcriptional regulator, biotin operon repressor / biotin---[acetyl-CoA-carboxylase] ligase
VTSPSPLVHRFERVASTMDEIHKLASDGAPAGTVVVADQQHASRGSRGRAWLSPPGGLWLSVLLRPSSGSGLELLSLRIGLTVSDTLSTLAGDILLRWPNDLMLADRKLGGILCDARWQGASLGWVAVGLGMNVANAVPPSLSGVATTLSAHVPGVTPGDLVEPMVLAITAADAVSARLSIEEVRRFAQRDWLVGRPLQEPIRGVAAGISDDGGLRVKLSEGGERIARAGTVELAGTPVRT